MQPGLKVGNTAEIEVEVTEDMCPAFDGVVVHRVYSTWSMAHHMELAARKVLSPHLDEQEEGIGSHLSIDHMAPCPVGCTVRVHAEAVELEDTTLVCTVSAWHGEQLLGKGTQVQRVLPKETLARLIERAGEEGGAA
ncbi:MAG: hotdog domain-containing protein [Planctomycetota bacterium]|nr:hotdog domain-containing protein [Planctomycetota bacterium]